MKAISDTGPLIHLNEINSLSSLKIFQEVFVPPEVAKELQNMNRFPGIKQVQLKQNKSIDKIALIAEKFDISLAESQAIALAKELHIENLLTDDLDARDAAKAVALTPVGTIGIIIASCKKKIISKTECVNRIRNLQTNSSLFVTSELIAYAIDKINKM